MADLQRSKWTSFE